jgi:hypothetical protein
MKKAGAQSVAGRREANYVVSDKASPPLRQSGEVWQGRIGGNSPPHPLRRTHLLLDEEGKCTVIAPGKEFKELAVNQLEGRTLASLSVADRSSSAPIPISIAGKK